jgi:uncharacterized membrane protein SpoIIM required for sporulation
MKIKHYCLLLILVFLLTMIVGYITAQPLTNFIKRLAHEHSGELSSKTQKWVIVLTTPITSYKGYKQQKLGDPRVLFKQTMVYFRHNTIIIAIILIISLPIFFFPLIQNGMMGYICGVILNLDGWNYFLKRITPHGLIELPLTFIVSAYAMTLGLSIWNASKTEKKKIFLGNLKQAIYIYLLSVPFSFIAAVLESYVRRLMWGI